MPAGRQERWQVNYTHCGRTALVMERQHAVEAAQAAVAQQVGAEGAEEDQLQQSEAASVGARRYAEVWVEGESSEEACPVRDASPTTNPFQAGNVLGEVSSILNSLDMRGGWNVGEKLGDAWEKLSATLDGLTPAEAASVGASASALSSASLSGLRAARAHRGWGGGWAGSGRQWASTRSL
jgi:hypothetical protein